MYIICNSILFLWPNFNTLVPALNNPDSSILVPRASRQGPRACDLR